MEGMKDYAGLSSVDKAQFVALHKALLLNAQNAFYQWQEGWLSPELWHAWDFVFGIFFSTPGGRQFWKERGYATCSDRSFKHTLSKSYGENPTLRRKRGAIQTSTSSQAWYSRIDMDVFSLRSPR